MTCLRHFTDPELATLEIYNFNKRFNPENWIVIKDESVIVNLSGLVGGDSITQFRWIRDTIISAS